MITDQILQNDLTKLALWSTTWQMPFNLAKCEHLTVTNKPHPSIYHYKINDYILYRKLSQLNLQYRTTYHGRHTFLESLAK